MKLDLKILDKVDKNINIIQSKPFLIFEIPEFLTDYQYDLLDKNFPRLDEKFFLKNNIKGHNLKYSFNSKSKIYKEFLKSNSTVNCLDNFIFNKKFSIKFLQKFRKDYFIARKNDLKYLIKLLRFKRIGKKNRNFFDKFLFTDISADIEYSYMINSAKIVPHTDSRQKLISLMMYFPEKEFTEKEKKELGTTFYISDYQNINNKHLETSKEIENFKKKIKSKITLPFKKKTLYGFIRNDKSWHNVEEFRFQNRKLIRRSININLYI